MSVTTGSKIYVLKDSRHAISLISLVQKDLLFSFHGGQHASKLVKKLCHWAALLWEISFLYLEIDFFLSPLIPEWYALIIESQHFRRSLLPKIVLQNSHFMWMLGRVAQGSCMNIFLANLNAWSHLMEMLVIITLPCDMVSIYSFIHDYIHKRSIIYFVWCRVWLVVY